MNKFRIVTFILIFIFVLLFVGAAFFFFPKQPASEGNEVQEKFINSYILTGKITSDILLDAVIDEVEPLLGKYIKFLRDDPNLSYAVVVNREGNIIASSTPADKGKKFQELYKISPVGEGSTVRVSDARQGVKDVGTTVSFKAGDKVIKVGELHLGVNVPENTSNTVAFMPFLAKLGIAGIAIFIVILILMQTFVFSDLQRRFAIYDREHRRIVDLESLNKEEDNYKKSIAGLKREKDRVQQEVDEIKKEISAKRKEVMESDTGKMVQELEEQKKILVQEIDKMNKEKEEIEKRLKSQKLEQEELKNRLDLIKEKMKKFIE